MLWEAVVALVLYSAGVGAPQHIHHLGEGCLLPDAPNQAHRRCSLIRHIPLQCSQAALCHANSLKVRADYVHLQSECKRCQSLCHDSRGRDDCRMQPFQQWRSTEAPCARKAPALRAVYTRMANRQHSVTHLLKYLAAVLRADVAGAVAALLRVEGLPKVRQ